MAENSGLIVCERLTDNGEGFDNERKPVSLNGKRALDEEMIMETEIDEHPSSKKSKTIMNGIDHSQTSQTNHPQSNTALHNGVVKDGNNSHTGANYELSEPVNGPRQISNGDETDRSIKTTLHSNQLATNTAFCNDIKPDLNIEEEEAKLKEIVKDNSSTIEKETLEGKKSGVTTEREPEIITLSDSEDEFQEVLMQAMSLTSSEYTRCKLLKLYQDQLRAEETKLILLRKLKQSLANIEKHPSAVAMDTNSKAVASSDMRSNTYVNPSASSQRGGNSGSNIPPPLKRGHQMSSPHHGLTNQHSSHKISANHHHQTMHNVDRHKMAVHQSNGQQSSGGPPPLVNMAKSSPHTANGSSSGYGGYQVPQVTQSKKPAAPPQPPPPPQPTKEQKLAAARIALKKQLEQALQQVPAPKPPPPEVNFLPSLASGEFVYLIGMEEVVKQLLSTDHRDVKFVFNPFSCVQCETDFTPVWKRDKPGSKNVICEKCITTNQKRVLKQEHTTKLKAVFSKAMQKEQEIERRIAAGSPLSDMPGLAVVAARHQKSHAPPAAAAAAAAAVVSASVATPSMPQLTPQHTQQSSASPNGGGGSSHQQQLTPQLQQQFLLSQQHEQMRAMLAAQMTLPYQLYGVTNKQAADLHRQYLLDMINQNRSSWKT